MRRRHFLAAALLALAGCDSFGVEPTGLQQGNVRPGTATLTIVNTTWKTVNAVYFAPCSEASYGASKGTIGAGERRSWTVRPDCYDIAMTLSSGTVSPTRAQIADGMEYELTLQ